MPGQPRTGRRVKSARPLPGLHGAHPELRTPELADLREATRMDGAGISRTESAISRLPGPFGDVTG